MTNSPLVATSINPFGRLDDQLRCFRAWKALGLRIRTLNIADEAARLRAAGLDDADIIELSPGETARNLHRIPSPRILPALYRIADAAREAPILLVNSDIYPAMKGIGAIGYWSRLAPAIAMTREECGSLETHEFLINRPYRGGLDIFLFREGVIQSVIARLSRCAAAERMAFGIPGWDYLLGMIIRSPEIGGMLCDSGLLLHETHKATYNTMDEFAHYLADIRSLTGSLSDDPTVAAAEIAALIHKDCVDQSALSETARAAYYSPCAADQPTEAADIRIASRLLALSPSLGWWLRAPAIARQAARERAATRPDFSRAQSLFELNPDPHYRFSQRLQATLFCLLCMEGNPRIAPPTTRYPANNLHGKVVDLMRGRTVEGTPERRLDFAYLYGSELVTHGLFNPRIHNYLVECCETDEERALMTEIHASIRSLADAA